MKFILKTSFLLTLLFSTFVQADHALWEKRRNLALSYFRPESQVSFSVGRELYQEAMSTGFYPRDFISWQGAQTSDELYYFDDSCLILVGLPRERCLRFNVNLNPASVLYLGWTFAQGYAQENLLRKALANAPLITAVERQDFLLRWPRFIEVEQYTQTYAMMWWHEINQHWTEISSRISGMGNPQDHDYALDFQRTPFSDVARHNEMSLNQFYAKFRDLNPFLTFVQWRWQRLHGQSVSWQVLAQNPRWAPVVEMLEKELIQLKIRAQN